MNKKFYYLCTGAANACLNIAKRLEGRRVPIMRIR